MLGPQEFDDAWTILGPQKFKDCLEIVPEDLVYQVVRAVFENFDTFRKFHPAFRILDKKQMIKDGLSAPLHSGAIKYYKEAGLM